MNNSTFIAAIGAGILLALVANLFEWRPGVTYAVGATVIVVLVVVDRAKAMTK